MKIAHRLFCKRSLAGEAIIVSIQIEKEKKTQKRHRGYNRILHYSSNLKKIVECCS